MGEAYSDGEVQVAQQWIEMVETQQSVDDDDGDLYDDVLPQYHPDDDLLLYEPSKFLALFLRVEFKHSVRSRSLPKAWDEIVLTHLGVNLSRRDDIVRLPSG